MGRIFAIGGGEIGYQGAPIETTVIDIEIIKATGKKHPNLLFLPTASGDALGYCEQIEIHFGERLGCNVDSLLVYSSPTGDEMAHQVRSADVIYVGGGNTLKMMQKWRQVGLDKLLTEAYQEGTVLAGLSAGAICWFEYGSSDALKETDPSQPYILVEGLGLEKGLITPHFNKEAGRPESQKELLAELDTVGIGIDERAALEINDNEFRVISADEKAGVTKSYWTDGEYQVTRLVASGYHELEELYQT